MPTLTRLQFTATIRAPAAVVWQHVTDADSHRHWTSAFAEGSRCEGAWHTGASIRFLGPNGDGMLSEIAESHAPVFLSIRHLGVLHQGVPDTTSDAVRGGGCVTAFQPMNRSCVLALHEQHDPRDRAMTVLARRCPQLASSARKKLSSIHPKHRQNH